MASRRPPFGYQPRATTSSKGSELHRILEKYCVTEKQLRDNGFPRPSEDGHNRAKFYTSRDQITEGNTRTCRRCNEIYFVVNDGTPVGQQPCFYHHARVNRKRVGNSLDARYGCCNMTPNAKGCQMAATHVNDRSMYDLNGYVKSLPAPESDLRNTNVFSLDCEMVFTKAGLELAHVTLIGDRCEVVYETLVKPDTDIIDYNTRFSGIRADDMKGVVTSLREVQATILSMVSDKTILIGHSLESDLTALKLIHNNVVDTSIVFPHRQGLPCKRALRNLVKDHLGRTIQADDAGHDCTEDAVACMELMFYKINVTT